jgi:hypothetical protein
MEVPKVVITDAMPLILARRDAAEYTAAYLEWIDSKDAEAWDMTTSAGVTDMAAIDATLRVHLAP